MAHAVMAESLAGTSALALAEEYGLSARTVEQLAQTVRGIDGQRVAEIKAAQDGLLTVLGSKMAVNAMKYVDSDAAKAVKYAFGAKLAVESAKIALPAAVRPGVQVLAFVGQLQVGPQSMTQPVILETAPESIDGEVLPADDSP